MDRRFLLAAALALVSGCSEDAVPSDDAARPPRDAGAMVEGGDAPTARVDDAFALVGDAPVVEPSLWEIVAGSEDFDILEAALLRASPVEGMAPTLLSELLDAPGAYTLLAPSDAAFEASGLTMEVVMETPPEALRDVLLYHGLTGEVPSPAATPGPRVTLAQYPLFLLVSRTGFTVNGGNGVRGGADVVRIDLRASNGVAHVIDRVLVPPTVEAIARYGGFTALAGALAERGLADELEGEGPFTLFAPTDEAFGALAELPTEDALTTLLRYHLTSGLVPSSALGATPAPLPTLAAAPYTVGGSAPQLSLVAREDGGTKRINGVPVRVADLTATNGLVHVVEAVLLPPSLLELASAAGASQLVAAIASAAPLREGGSVASLLSEPSARLTFFVPSNEALAATFPSGLPADGEAVRDLLLYHLLASPTPGVVLSRALPTEPAELPTALGPTSPFLPETPARLDGQPMAVTDLVGINGVVHVLAGVLSPPTLRDLVVESDAFDILEAALLRASPLPGARPTPLVDTLEAPGDLTLLAPTDAAFEASGLDLATVRVTAPDVLRDVLLYHMRSGRLVAARIATGTEDSLSGLPLFLRRSADGASVNGGRAIEGGADITRTDVLASNGVLHVIDRVLLPPTVEAIARYAGLATLSAAVASEGLVAELSGEGPFTWFAPTDEAFAGLAELPSGDALTSLLRYHVTRGLVPSSAVTGTSPLPTLARAPYEVASGAPPLSLVARLDGRTVLINGSGLVSADLRATNGLVHVVGAVLLPPSVREIAAAAGLRRFEEALTSAAPLESGGSLSESLADPGARWTLFAPTDEAFEAAFPGYFDAEPAFLRDMLLYHLLASPSPGVVLSAELLGEPAEIATQLGPTLPFAPGAPPTVGAEPLVTTDIVAVNGVVHLVGGVLLPPPG
jgi:transforming growth factor-beta-induced protein